MLKLISYMPNNNSIADFDNLKNQFMTLNLDGIETVIGDYCDSSIFENLPIHGAHLIYFPTWLDIWKENHKNLMEDFSSVEPFGIKSKSDLINIYKKEFENAKKHNVKYMVFHVSHVRPRDIFTFSYDYTDKEIFHSALELINEVFHSDYDGDNDNNMDCNCPILLFENLPWPGFRLGDENSILDFLQNIKYKNIGIMIDFSHLMCLNKDINSYDEGALYIEETLKKHPLLMPYIKGVHLNGSLSKSYLSQDFSSFLSSWENAQGFDKYHIEISHIKNIDTHNIFESNKISKIINNLNLEFLVYELSHSSLTDLLERVKVQNTFLDLA